MRDCPIEGCPAKWKTVDGLFAHLTTKHRKNELVYALILLGAKTLKP